MEPAVSIVIRTKNESKYLGKVLESLKRQKYQGPVEIIIVDSGSTDNTLEIAKAFSCKIIEIKPEDFSFGAALNIGIQNATGEIIINISGHSVPENPDYLSLMIAPFVDKYVGATYGRDIPWPDACPSQARDVLCYFPDTELDGSKFSNANAAIRKSCWKIVPFDEKMPAAEDLLWAKQIMGLGYLIKYIPEARVYHSHSPSLKYIKKRSYIESKSLNALADTKHDFNIQRAIRFFLGQTLKDITFTIERRYNPLWLLHIPFYRIFQTVGLYRGFKEGYNLKLDQISNAKIQDNSSIVAALGENQAKKSKRVLLVVHCFLPESIGGTEIYTYRLAKGLKKRGWDVLILTAIRNPSLKRYSLLRMKFEGIDVVKINNPPTYNLKFLDYIIDLNIDQIYRDILKSFRPNLTHFQHTAFLSSRMPEINYQESIPSIFTLHDYWYICFRGQLLRPNETVCPGTSDGLFCATCTDNNLFEPSVVPRFPRLMRFLQMPLFNNFKKLLSDQLKNEFKKFLYISPKKNNHAYLNNLYPSSPEMWAILEHSFRLTFMKKQLSLAEYIISPSNHLKKRYEKESFKKIIHIPHGLEPRSKIKNINYTEKLTIAYLSNIIPFKGAHILLEELQYVPNKEKIKLLFYGKVLNYIYYEQLNNLIKKIPEADISFMGTYKGIDELSSIIQTQNIHITVLPSIWEETYALVVAESLLLGVPVICSSIGGAKENILDGINGLLFNPFKKGDLADKINSLINDPSLLLKLKKGAEDTKILTMEEHLDKIESLYNNTLSQDKEHR
ncbi:MAG: glycosyltransferase [Thermodesulfovibrionales bacterium]|nr:glycosyltransferase [Thermodesulfovibrionales bacterium]